jgi:hypothetical protein
MDVQPSPSKPPESSNSSTFHGDFISFLRSIQTTYPWFVRLVFWAIAQYVRGDRALRNKLDATLVKILVDLACAVISTAGVLIPYKCTIIPENYTRTLRHYYPGLLLNRKGPYECSFVPSNYIQVPSNCGIMYDPSDIEFPLMHGYFLPRAYDMASSIDTDGLIDFIREIMDHRTFDLNDISFALRTEWVPSLITTMREVAIPDDHSDFSCEFYINFRLTFCEKLHQWFHGEYPQDFVPSGCDPLRILHDRFPE